MGIIEKHFLIWSNQLELDVPGNNKSYEAWIHKDQYKKVNHFRHILSIILSQISKFLLNYVLSQKCLVYYFVSHKYSIFF